RLILRRRPPVLTVLPYTTLFRSIQSAELRALLADWLHGVYVCPDMDSAMAARAHLPAGHQYVTKEGHLVGRYSIRYYAPDSEARSEEHTSELQSRETLVCRLLLE